MSNNKSLLVSGNQLIRYCRDGKVDDVRKALSQPPSMVMLMVNYRNEAAVTPLMTAAAEGQLEIVVDLLKNKAQVNYVNNKNESALHLAVYNGHSGVVQVLLQAGIDYTLEDVNGKTARSRARPWKREIVRIIDEWDNKPPDERKAAINEANLSRARSPTSSTS